jgi:hypothetical protein
MKRCLKFGVGGCEKIRGKFPKITSETVEKANFGSLVLLRDPNFVVCPIW